MININIKNQERFQIFVIYTILAVILISTTIFTHFKNAKRIELLEASYIELEEMVDRLTEENKNLKESVVDLNMKRNHLEKANELLRKVNRELNALLNKKENSTSSKVSRGTAIKQTTTKATPPKEKENITKNAQGRTAEFEATAYDLTVASCGKKPSHPQYGITASGVSLVGKDLKDRMVAVDRNLIKLGSKIHIEFYEPYTHLTGYYTAVDTGGAIKGNKVDIYFGELKVSEQVKQFGRRKVKVTY